METIKITDTQIKILERNTISGYQNSTLYPIHGAGEHRSAQSLENKGIAKMVPCAPHEHWFLKLNDGFRFNFVTSLLETEES